MNNKYIMTSNSLQMKKALLKINQKLKNRYNKVNKIRKYKNQQTH